MQLALFDLIFNVAPTGLTKFTQFNAAIMWPTPTVTWPTQQRGLR